MQQTQTTATPPRRDYLLLAVSLLFTGASLASTLAGARVLLGDTRWALALGIGVQAVPILLATGLAGHNYSRSLRTFVGGLCVSLSIYASTAWFAPSLAGPTLAFQSRQQAEQAHARLVATLVAPAVVTADEANAAVAGMQQRLAAEKAHGLKGKRAGIGKEYRKQEEQLIDLQSRAAVANGQALALRNSLEFDTSGLSPEELLAKDRDAWRAAPPDLRAACPEPTADTYLPAVEQRSPMLRPAYDLANRAPFATQAFVIAIILDLIGLLVGMGVPVRPIRPRVGAIRRAGYFLTNVIRAVRHVVVAIYRGLIHPQDPVLIAPVENGGQLDYAMQNISQKLDGQIADFAWMMVQALRPEDCTLDVCRLEQFFADDPNKLQSLRILLAALATPHIGWLKYDQEQGWFCPEEERFAALQTYLLQQLARVQYEQQARKSKATEEERRLLRRILRWLAGFLPPPDGPTSMSR